MLDEFIEAFLLHRESEGKSFKTLKWHRGNLGLFSTWIKESGLEQDPSKWDSTIIRRYLIHLRTRESARGTPLSGYSIRSYGTSVRAFCRWLHEEEFTKSNSAHRVRLPKTPILVKPPFTKEEIRKLLSAASRDKRNGVRDVAMILFLLDSGCRAAECVSLRIDQIVWSQRMATVHGKGDKQRVIVFSIDTMKALSRYRVRRNAECPTFFQTEEGRAMTTAGLLNMVKRIGKRASVANVSVHRFRHTFAVFFLRNGGNVVVLQKLMGHTSIAVTQGYLALLDSDLIEAHQKSSPVGTLFR